VTQELICANQLNTVLDQKFSAIPRCWLGCENLLWLMFCPMRREPIAQTACNSVVDFKALCFKFGSEPSHRSNDKMSTLAMPSF
jgi:hypothetical protein